MPSLKQYFPEIVLASIINLLALSTNFLKPYENPLAHVKIPLPKSKMLALNKVHMYSYNSSYVLAYKNHFFNWAQGRELSLTLRSISLALRYRAKLKCEPCI